MRRIILLLASAFLLCGASYQYNKTIDVQKLASEIEAEMSYSLVAKCSTDTVHGYINYAGGNIIISFYNSDEAANSNHSTTFDGTILTSEEETQLDTIISNHIP